MKIRNYYYIFLSAFLILPIFADSKTLEVNRVIESVSRHFPVIIAEQANIAKAKANLLSAQGGFDPVIKSQLLSSTIGVYRNLYLDTEISTPISDTGNKIFTGYRVGRGKFPVYDQKMWTYSQGELRAGIEIPWLRDNKIDDRRAKILTSQSYVNINERELDLKKLQVVRDAVFSYWDWYTEGSKLLIQKQLLQLAKDRQNVLRYRFEKGDIPEIDVTENLRLIMQREISLAQQTQNYQKAELLLSLYYRDKQGKPIIPNSYELPKIHQDVKSIHLNEHHSSEISTILSRHPVMKQLAEQRNISFVDLSIAENNLKPKLSNSIYVSQDFGAGNPPLNYTSINFQLSFELPVYRRQAIGAIQAAKSSLERIDQDKAMFIDRLNVNIKNALNQIHTINQIIDLTKRELAIAKKLEHAEQNKYEHGDSNLFLINLREQSTVETKIKLITALSDSKKARQDLLYALGNNLSINH